jgi:hypothetical protein
MFCVIESAWDIYRIITILQFTHHHRVMRIKGNSRITLDVYKRAISATKRKCVEVPLGVILVPLDCLAPEFPDTDWPLAQIVGSLIPMWTSALRF